MAKYKIQKKWKIAIIILVIVTTFSIKVYAMDKKHVNYKRPNKPTLGKKVKLKKAKFNFRLRRTDLQKEASTTPLDRMIRAGDEQVAVISKAEDIIYQQNIQKQLKLQRQKEALRQQQLQQQNNIEINRGGRDTTQGQQVKIEMTFYTSSVSNCGNNLGITTSGKKDQSGYVAAPKNVPMGTIINIPNRGNYVVEDRGGAIIWKGDIMKIDVFVPNATEEQLNQMGVIYTTGTLSN